ncbi:MAG TPA: alpha/beta hydrolase fold domain-containing protein [Stellaceae bacterium]|nr:alpha/beta hydrolase fold domain-containing protein [Stellaceae bacterium]
MQQQSGVTFATHDGVALLGDLYLPEGAGPHPAVIAVHGGGWQQGTRAGYRHWGPYLATRGIALFAVDYRLAKPNQKSFPEAVHDIRAAVQYLRGSAATLKLDPKRIALMGDSAGAHLAALVALAGDAPLFAGAYREDEFAKESTRVKAVIGLYGVYDLAAQWQHDLVARPRDQITEKFLGAAPIDNRRIYFDASPISYATRDNNQTAFLIAYGTEDDVVDVATQSAVFLTALKQAGIFARISIIEGAPHFWGGDPIEEPESFSGFFAPRLMRFLAERL